MCSSGGAYVPQFGMCAISGHRTPPCYASPIITSLIICAILPPGRVAGHAFSIPSGCACGRLAQTVAGLRRRDGAMRRAEEVAPRRIGAAFRAHGSGPQSSKPTLRYPGADRNLESLWQRRPGSWRDLTAVRRRFRFRRKLSHIAPVSTFYAASLSPDSEGGRNGINEGAKAPRAAL